MDPRHIGERLLTERRRRGLTQADVAREVGVSQSHISGIEKGHSLEWTTIKKLCKLYEIKYEDLVLRGIGDRTATNDAIDGDPELTVTDRSLLAAIYDLMRKRGPLTDGSAV